MNCEPPLDYCAFVPVVNRPDLLQNVVAAAAPLHDNFTIIDNSPERWVLKSGASETSGVRGASSNPASSANPAVFPANPAVKVFQPPVPFSFTQTMNWEMEETLRQNKIFCVHMHSDAVIPQGACGQLLAYARNIRNTHPKWGVIYTYYDILAVYNPQAYESIGGFDTSFAAYFSDNDWYRRLDLAGWERLESGIAVGHLGSQTINSDAYLRHINGVTFPLYAEYYRQKWGGAPGQETFNDPFGVRPRNWKLQ